LLGCGAQVFAHRTCQGLHVKVIGAGYTRTGTVSLKTALEILDLGPCLHPLSAPEPVGALVQAGGVSETLDWRGDLDSWNAAVGWIGALHYTELLEAWPTARVVLTVRDPESWYQSYSSCLRATRELAMTGGPNLAAVEAAVSDGLMMLDRPLWKGVLDGSYEDRTHALERYRRHNEEVLASVPADQLLVYDIAEGWGPLCGFLEIPLPEVEFPRLNDRADFQASFAPGGKPLANRPLVQSTTPRISRLALADPERSFSQQEVLDALGMADDPFAQRIFASCGVKHRHLTLLAEHADESLQGRSALSEEHLFELAVRAVDQLGVDMTEIETIVSASLYSLGGPTIAHRLVEHYELSPSTDKYHVVGVGCASAVPLVRLVSRSLSDRPGAKGLIVAAESMSGLLTHATPDDPRAKVIGAAIFGDGCAAAIIESGADAPGPAVVASTVHQIPGTLDAVQMAVTNEDSHLSLTRELPALAGAGLDALVEEFLQPLGLTRYAIDHWLIHPGGRRIIESVQTALSLPDEEVQISYGTLAAHGNVGTPSIFYVLNETISQRAPASGDRGLMVTVGPGITVGLMLLVF
jgi:predicted naringenin-chalcone synthase